MNTAPEQTLDAQKGAPDRRAALVDALRRDDLLTLMDATREELLEDLSRDPEIIKTIPDARHVLYTAWWWGYMRSEARSSGAPFVLPDVVQANLHWKPSSEKDPFADSYSII